LQLVVLKPPGSLTNSVDCLNLKKDDRTRKYYYQSVRKSECRDAKEDEMLEWVPAGLNTGALSGAKASSSRTRDTYSLDDLLVDV
jgi:hypothetical protein